MKRFSISKFVGSLAMAFLLLLTLSSGQNKDLSSLDFKLLNVDAKYLSLKDYPDAKGFIIIFTCNHCPYANQYISRLNRINTKYSALGVPVIAISSTDATIYEEDSYEKMVQKAKQEQFNFPYLYDPDQVAAKKFNAQKTPHAFVIWKNEKRWEIRYNGAIDDNCSEENLVKQAYVCNAVDALLKNQSVEIKETKSIGCQLHLRK